MLRIVILAIAILFDPAIAPAADMSDCNQLPRLSSARLRWAAVRKSLTDPAHKEESCRSYGSKFLEAVMTRQAVSFCGNVIDRNQLLELLDTEIDALNDLIAAHCSVQ